MQTRIAECRVEFEEQQFVAPLQLSTGVITHITEARVTVHAETEGREADGRGSIYLSDLWAWPDPALDHATRDAHLRTFCEALAADLPGWCGGEAAHPLDLGLRLHDALHGWTPGAGRPALPMLALAMCASPFDAAIHDAAGIATGQSAFAFYRDPIELPSADALFNGPGKAVTAIGAMLRPEPRNALEAWVVINKTDGPEELRRWVHERGYTCYKLKLMGKDADVDADRTAEAYGMLRSLGVDKPRLTGDTNEANPDADSVGAYLEALQSRAPEAFAALEYLEQPTGRDIAKHAYDWRPVTALKPVLLDEGLTDFSCLELAQQQGWSGLALKTCKGHSFALAAAAWAHARGLTLALQDLTNPGYALIHAALMGAWLPTVNGVELNAAQFTPKANAPWLPRLEALMEPTNGLHQLPHTRPPGLGSRL